MSLVVLVVERRILKALKMGGGIETSREAQLSTAKQINHETHR